MYDLRHCVPLRFSKSGGISGKSTLETEDKWPKFPVSFGFGSKGGVFEKDRKVRKPCTKRPEFLVHNFKILNWDVRMSHIYHFFMQSKNTLKTILTRSEAKINSFLVFVAHMKYKTDYLRTGIFVWFWNFRNFYFELWFLWTGVSDLSFGKIFYKFRETFGVRNPFFYFWNCFDCQKTGKVFGLFSTLKIFGQRSALV